MKQIHVGMLSFLLFIACNNPKPSETAETTNDTTQTKTQPAEFADARYMAIGKSGIASMASGDIDTEDVKYMLADVSEEGLEQFLAKYAAGNEPVTN